MTRKLLDTPYNEGLQERTIARSFFNVNKNIGKAGVVEYDTQLMLQKAAERKNEKSSYSGNTVGSYITKTVKPVVYKENFEVSADSIQEKQFGGSNDILSPEQILLVPDFVRNVVVPEASEVIDKIVTDLDLQAIEILTTGGISGNGKFEGVEYIPSGDVNHFATAPVLWTDNAATPISDLTALAKTIKRNGKKSIDNIIMNDVTFDKFISRASVKDALETRRIELGSIALPANTASSANYFGDILIAGKRVKVWVESADYENDADVTVPFIPNNKVILVSDDNRFEQHFGSLARFDVDASNANLANLLSGGINVENNLQINQLAIVDRYQQGLEVALDGKALLVAKSKGFGCLTVG